MVVGTPTFGKGLVQTLFPLGDGVALKLTTARWYTPSGRTIQRIAKNEEDQMVQAVLKRRQRGGRSPTRHSGLRHPSAPDLPHRRRPHGAGRRRHRARHRRAARYADHRRAGLRQGARQRSCRTTATSSPPTPSSSSGARGWSNESFKVTPEMRQQVLSAAQGQGRRGHRRRSSTPPRTLVDEQLGYEVARYLFGRPAEFKRRSLDDRQLQTAFSLLRKAQTPKDLMGLAMASASATGTH